MLDCLIIRLMLLLGESNYGKRGILDMTHTRLFTFSSLARLLEQRGFQVIRSRGIPAPIPLALGDSQLSRFLFLMALNTACIRLLPKLFPIKSSWRRFPSLRWRCFSSEPSPNRRRGRIL